ncbi:WASH complex subunit 2A isoform X2 [Xenopus laevis]|uniref:WASH complex subunit 2A isoform X2 n=1 Tax=Xenopus laevis TaxID=8355 RepID=A0A8J0T7T6_XENLA|nr:WASH complex subunit 2A isoform X2 [Xenopus laevis]
MNGPANCSAETPVWERPWGLEEIRRSSQNWSLGADAGLLNFLREFSQQTISRTHEIEKQLDGLIREAKATDCRLHNVFNDFLMLSNTQFIENRVYDEEVEDHVVKADAGNKPEQEKTREQKEAELIPKIQEAVNYGLQVLENAFEQLDIKAGNSDSEEEEVNERVDLILEPKDLYIDRPLPLLIGSQQFMQQEDVGLGDLSSEEGSVDNDRGSIIDSEDEKEDEESEDEFDNNSEEEKKLHSALSDEDEDNGSDLFGDSDKEEEEEEEEEDNKTTKTRTRSFADELAARIQSDIPRTQESDQSSVASLEVKNKKEKDKKEVKKLPSDDEEDDFFKPPKLTDEDFSPFGSKGGLFSGGKGLFDDDDDEGDIFADVQKKEVKKTEPSPLINSETTKVKKKPPVGGVSLFPGGENVIGSSILAEKDKNKSLTPTLDVAPKPPPSSSLFADDEDGLFGSPNTHTSKPERSQPTSDLFADDDDLFQDKPSAPIVAKNKVKENDSAKENNIESKNHEVPVEKSKPLESSMKKQTKGLFSDEDDSESDLFSPVQSSSKSKSAVLPAAKTALSLFDDEEEDLFASVPDKKQTVTVKKPALPAKLASEENAPKSGLFSSDEEDPIGTSNQTNAKDAAKIKREEPSGKKTTTLFDDTEDLFAITKDSEKKNNRVSLLFEDDNEGSLFSSVSIPAAPTSQTPLSPKEESKDAVPNKLAHSSKKESLLDKPKKTTEVKKSEPEPPLSGSENKEPLQESEKVKQSAFTEPREDNFFATSPPVDKHGKIKSKNVLSLFDDEEDNGFENHTEKSITQREPGKASSETSSHTKSTGVFQDEELLFSQELQKDNDPDVDLFASSKKPPSEKSSHAKPSAGMGLFGDEEEDDLFSTAKPKKAPKVPEKKPMNIKDRADIPKEPPKATEVKEANILRKENAECPTDSVSVKSKGPSSRIGKLQANLHINPAAMLPGAVPKFPGIRPAFVGISLSPHADTTESSTSPTASTGIEGVSFESPVQIDTLHSANKTRPKNARRRPPTRMGRKLSSQDSGETEDHSGVAPTSNMADATPALGPSNSHQQLDPTISTMKLSLSENDVQSRANTKVTAKPLTPDINDLFGSDLFAKSLLPTPDASRKQDHPPDNSFTNKPGLGAEKKSSALVIDAENSDDDLFQTVKHKSVKSPKPASVMNSEARDDLFGASKPQKKVDIKTVQPKEAKSKASNIFEDDIFATEVVKPVKKTKEKKQPSESNLFDEHVDIFADLTQKGKEKKSKKKVEPKSIFDDDMDDIFASGSVKNTKQKAKPSEASVEVKPESKVSSIFDDPLNVFSK